MEAEADSNGGSDRALAGTVGSEDHVEVWTRAELDVVVGHETRDLDPHNRAGNVAVVNMMSAEVVSPVVSALKLWAVGLLHDDLLVVIIVTDELVVAVGHDGAPLALDWRL